MGVVSNTSRYTSTSAPLRNVSAAKATARRMARRRHGGSAGRGDDARSMASADGAIRGLQSDGAIDRPGTATPREQEEQDRGPGQMLGVGVGVDEGLDHRDHPEQRQRRQPGAEPQDQQER